MRKRCTWSRSRGVARILHVPLGIALALSLHHEQALACMGFCDSGVENACGRLFRSRSRQEAATAAIGVVRAYDALAAREKMYRAPNYRVDRTTDLFSWCEWATSRG